MAPAKVEFVSPKTITKSGFDFIIAESNINISKESAVVLLDELRAVTAARSERTNFLLTVVASIFLPLTFLTGLIGMNVVGIPYANHPYSFWVIVSVCAAIAVVQIMLFRRWKWL